MDATLNFPLGLRSSALLARALVERPFIRPIVLALKSYLLLHGLHQPYGGGVSGFLLANMVHWALMQLPPHSQRAGDYDDDDDEFDDILSVLTRFDLQNALEIYGHIKANTVPDGQNKYNYIYNHINDFLTPFIDSDDKTDIITKMAVNENLNVVIDNLEDFYATMLEDAKILPKKEEHIVRERFVIDRYNLGLNKLHNPDIKNKQSRAHIEELTQSDKLSLKGFLTLEAPYLQYSKINLPMTSIYEKSKLNNYVFLYSDLFKEDTPIERQVITEDGISSQNNVEFLNKKREYTFKELRNYVDRERETTYEEFLNNIIPKTKSCNKRYF